MHDGDIAPMLAALGIFHDIDHDPYLPITHIPSKRKWKTSQIMPMGGRVIFEGLTCRKTAEGTNDIVEQLERFVRVNINDKIIPLPNCVSGPGQSCPLSEFDEFIRKRGIEIGDFGEVCGLQEDYERRISFLRQ